MTQASIFRAADFSAPSARTRWFVDCVLRRVDADAPLRVLDIGCGTGEHVLALAARMPHATFCGIDVSPANIRRAQEVRDASPFANRISFDCADYLQHSAGQFDLAVSDSAIHLIHGDSAALLDKIARDLVRGGLLVASLPDCGLYNRLLWSGRRLLRGLRTPWLDEFALRLALRIHRGRYDEPLLRQRVPYLYVLPYRCEGPALRRQARVAGLAWQRSEPAPHDSLMQPVHVLATYRCEA